MDTPPSPNQPPPQPRLQFTLARLLVAMFLFAVLAASLGGMMRPDIRTENRSLFIMITIGSPVGTMILFGLCHSALQWYRRYRDGE